MGDGVSLPIPPQFGCDKCILTHITLYLNQKGGKSRAKLVGSSWYLTPLLWDTPCCLRDACDTRCLLDCAWRPPWLFSALRTFRVLSPDLAPVTRNVFAALDMRSMSRTGWCPCYLYEK